MNPLSRLFWIILISGAAASATGGNLRIYLPAEKTVESELPLLGETAMLIGDDMLVKEAGAVNIGQFSASGQLLLIDRQTVLSCLAAKGIMAGQVQFNGSELMRVKRNEKMISAERFLATAREYLENHLADQKTAAFKLFRPAQDYVLGGQMSGIQLKARMSGQQSRGMQRVTVAVMHEGVEIYRQELLFSVQYERKRPVAVERIEAGAVIGPDDVKLEAYLSNLPEEDGVFLPYGMIAKRAIDAGKPIEAVMVQPKEAPILVKRQQQVVLRIDSDALLISAHGQAMEDGRVGDLVRVRRGSRATNDERFVVGRVMQDGTVRPIVN
jgi:flagella basal body P-ring formation protein FlgA